MDKTQNIRLLASLLFTGSVTFVLAALAGLSCLPNREPTAPIEIDRPIARTIVPEPGSLVVSRTTRLRFQFNERMNAQTFVGHFELRDASGTLFPGGFSSADTSVMFTPSQQLAASTVFKGVLHGRVRDAQNSSIAIGGEPILDDTTVLMTTWFYTEGDYSQNGFHHVFMRDRKEGKIRIFGKLDSVVATITGLGAPEGMALSTDGMHLFVSNTTKDSVYSINTQSNAIEAGFHLAAAPSSIVAYGNFVYVISVNGRMLTKINATTLTLQSQTALSFFPARLAISPDGATLYTIDQVSRDLVLLRESDGGLIKRLSSAVSQVVAGDLVVEPISGNVYVCDSKALKIKFTDGAGTTFSTFMSFTAGTEPVTIAFGPGSGGEFYVAAGKTVQRGTLSRPDSMTTTTFSGAVRTLGLVPTGDILFATYSLSVVILDARTLAVLKEIPVTSSGIEAIVASSTKYQ